MQMLIRRVLGMLAISVGTVILSAAPEVVVAQVSVSVESTGGTVGEHITIPLTIGASDEEEIEAFEFELSYDPAVLNVTGVAASGTLAEDYSIEANTSNSGTVVVAGAGSDALSGAGTLMELEAELLNDGSSTVTFERFTFNEGVPTAAASGGTVSVEPQDNVEHERELYSVPDDQLPLYFGDRLGVQRSVTVDLDPSEAGGAEVVVSAYDINTTGEATMYVNGTAVDLPETITGFGETKTASVEIDPSLLTAGTNTITFEISKLVDGASTSYRYRVDAVGVALLFGDSTEGGDDGTEGDGTDGDQEHNIVHVSSDQLPLYFGDRLGVQRSATLELDSSGVEGAEVIVTAYDINSTDEATMHVNGTEVDLPEVITGFGTSETAAVSIDPSLLQNGTNRLTFETAALVDGAEDNFRFRIEELAVALLGEPTGGGEEEGDETEDGDGDDQTETRTEYIAFDGNLPLYFGDRVGTQRSVTASLDPSTIEAADVEVTAYDINSTDEAAMYVNGTEVDIPEAITGFGERKTASVEIDPSLLTDGTNTITFEITALVDGEANFYRYKVEEVTLAAEVTGEEPIAKEASSKPVAGISRQAERPTEFRLGGNYPNPFNPTTTIVVDLPMRAQVSVQVYDMLGREVMHIPARAMSPGAGQEIQLEASRLSSGTYLYRVVVEARNDRFVETGRMTLVK